MNKIFAWLWARLRAGRTVEVKLTLSLMLAAALPLIAVGVSFSLVNSRLAKRELGASLSTLAGVMAANSSATLAFDDAKAAQETLASLRQDPSIAAASSSHRVRARARRPVPRRCGRPTPARSCPQSR